MHRMVSSVVCIVRGCIVCPVHCACTRPRTGAAWRVHRAPHARPHTLEILCDGHVRGFCEIRYTQPLSVITGASQLTRRTDRRDTVVRDVRSSDVTDCGSETDLSGSRRVLERYARMHTDRQT